MAGPPVGLRPSAICSCKVFIIIIIIIAHFGVPKGGSMVPTKPLIDPPLLQA